MTGRRQRSDGLPHARKRFGQHFLRDSRTLDAIVTALEPLEGVTVVEIGPGRGALTDRLVERAARVVAVEIDRDLAAHLRARYATRRHVTIVEADVLAVPLASLVGDGEYVLAGNVPYYITTPILFHALEPPRPARAVYLVQREVADRMAANPGSKEYGALSVNLQAFAECEFIRAVPPGAFSPPPSVESAVVRVRPRAAEVIEPRLEGRYRTLVQAAFGLRRKQLQRVVRTIASMDAETAAAHIAAAGLRNDQRPETLSPEDFARLTRRLST